MVDIYGYYGYGDAVYCSNDFAADWYGWPTDYQNTYVTLTDVTVNHGHSYFYIDHNEWYDS